MSILSHFYLDKSASTSAIESTKDNPLQFARLWNCSLLRFNDARSKDFMTAADVPGQVSGRQARNSVNLLSTKKSDRFEVELHG